MFTTLSLLLPVSHTVWLHHVCIGMKPLRKWHPCMIKNSALHIYNTASFISQNWPTECTIRYFLSVSYLSSVKIDLQTLQYSIFILHQPKWPAEYQPKCHAEYNTVSLSFISQNWPAECQLYNKVSLSFISQNDLQNAYFTIQRLYPASAKIDLQNGCFKTQHLSPSLTKINYRMQKIY